MTLRPVTTKSLRLAVCLAALLSTSLVSCGPGGVNDPSRPVVVLITLDTTRADYLGCYGSPLAAASPRIDGLAREGVLFRQSISQAAVTPVSHASIMTGLYPYHHGLRVMHGTSQNTLGAEQVTLAEILAERGYDTGAFVSAFPVSEYFGFAQGFDTFDEDFTAASPSELVQEGMVNTGRAQRNAGETTERALKWMEEREEPFFLWLHYFDPHDEHVLPPDGLPPELSTGERDRDWRRRLYSFEITYMDGQVGLVFDKLKELGLWDNSVVVVTSDHGEGLGDHDWWTHGILYQEQVRVPLIVRGPGMPAGKVVTPVVRSIDIVPTVSELLQLADEDLPPMDGTSLVRLMTGASADLQLSAYTDSVNTMVYQTGKGMRDNKSDLLFAIVFDNRWKYIQHLKQREKSELYDLQADPAELHNVLDEKPAIAERARGLLREIEFMPYAQLEEGGTPQEVLDKLRALGYLGADDTPVDAEAGTDSTDG